MLSICHLSKMIHHTADLSISTSSQQVEGRFETPSSFTGNGFTVEGTMHKVCVVTSLHRSVCEREFSFA